MMKPEQNLRVPYNQGFDWEEIAPEYFSGGTAFSQHASLVGAIVKTKKDEEEFYSWSLQLHVDGSLPILLSYGSSSKLESAKKAVDAICGTYAVTTLALLCSVQEKVSFKQWVDKNPGWATGLARENR